MTRFSLLVTATLALAACSGGAAPALPPVQPAPVAACLTMYLAEAPAPENVYARDVQNAVRKSFELAMVGAGFNVVGDAALPHDLAAKLEILPGSRVATGSEVKATLALERAGKPIDKIEVSALQETPGFDGVVADQLVDGLFRSPQLAAFTRDLRKPGSKDHLAAASLRVALAKGSCATPGAEPSGTPIVEAPPTPAAPPAPAFLSGAAQPNAYAFIVGVDDYKTAGRAAKGRADAERFADIARRTLGIPEAHIKLSLGEKADKIGLDVTLEWLKANVPPGARIYFYFSGKGALLGRRSASFLVPYDGDLGNMEATCIGLSAFLKALTTTKAKDVVAFVDAGYAGVGPRSASQPGGKPPQKISAPDVPPRVTFVSAVTSADAALEAEGGGGLFSRYLADALGQGRADFDGDGRLTVQEIASWLAPRVARDAKKQGKQQTPTIIVGPGSEKPTAVTVASGLPPQ